ncbi:ABC transporter substrate-binding protein [Acuticoccus sediminis]|uniref:ABC transporter substrate-binding protein n=1 Tax=Acuticoccus sediminis TaxID=2184697 RepID=A0A8B2P396_9HYPH|nr:ABC transporter substrate-binding protein [Acuticoccus sediminis]RAI04424.1 ABC transporter substrate-binding protein [Acuticoccus sediminis]
MLSRLCLAVALLVLPLSAMAQVERPLVVGMALEPPHLDPTAGAAAAIDEVLYDNVFQGLTQIAADGTVQPQLATGWEVADDGMSWTFTLREGVTFHDGKPFDASVAKFALDRFRAAGAENAQPQLFAAIDSVEAVDPTTLKITLSRPDANLPYSLGWGDAVMVHPDSADGNKQAPVGTGPFMFEDWRRGDRVILTRYDGYWGEPARVPRVEFAFVSDPGTALASLLAGDVNAYPNFPAPEQVPVLEANESFTVEIGTTEGEVILAINSARAPFDKLEVRQAISAAINRDVLIAGAMYGAGTPIGSHMPPHNPAYIDLTGVNGYDPDRARALLADAGVTNLSLTITLPPPAYARRSGELIAAQLRQVGIDVSLKPVEWAEWLSSAFKGKDYDLTIVAHTEPNDIGIYGRPDYYFHVANARLDEVLAKLGTEADPDARIGLLQEAQKLIADDAVNAFLFVLPKIGVWDARLTGFWHDSPIQANDVTHVEWKE